MKEIVAAIITENRNVLLVNNNGNWFFSGGTREDSESDVGCLVREFGEEFSGSKIDNFSYYVKSAMQKTPHLKNMLFLTTVKIWKILKL